MIRRLSSVESRIPRGAAVPGASVTLVSDSTGQVRKIVANETGQYLFPSLPVGTYSLAVEQPAFKRYERTGILLQANGKREG